MELLPKVTYLGPREVAERRENCDGADRGEAVELPSERRARRRRHADRVSGSSRLGRCHRDPRASGTCRSASRRRRREREFGSIPATSRDELPSVPVNVVDDEEIPPDPEWLEGRGDMRYDRGRLEIRNAG